MDALQSAAAFSADAEHGDISPARFVPVAEEAGVDYRYAHLAYAEPLSATAAVAGQGDCRTGRSQRLRERDSVPGARQCCGLRLNLLTTPVG